MWGWSQQTDFHHCWAKNCMGIPYSIPEIQWFYLKQIKTAHFKHSEHFPSIQKFNKTNFAANNFEYVWDWSQQTYFHHYWAKKCMGIPWGIPEIQGFCLKQPILSILRIFQIYKNLKKQILLQTTMNMCETGHNNLTFTTVEQKMAWEYRHTWDTGI